LLSLFPVTSPKVSGSSSWKYSSQKDWWWFMDGFEGEVEIFVFNYTIWSLFSSYIGKAFN
jgi:hypothetical protein